MITSCLMPGAIAAAEVRSDSLKPLAGADWDRGAAAHLLRRAGFCGTPTQVDELAAMTVERAVESLLNCDEPYAPAPPLFDDELMRAVDRRAQRELSEDERRQIQQKRQRLERAAFEETRLWWIERLIESPRPFEEKMTLFWHGHFTSGFREVRNPIFMREQNEFLRRHALANFADLVQGISRDRAMLVYLDGARNNKKQPNENYARELMELFTLGVGHYSEADIKEAARAFTGWGYDRYGFRFNPRNHDYGSKRFLGRDGKLDGDDVVDAILAKPECSMFLARNLLEFFVRPDPERKLVAALAGQIRRHKYEMAPVMKALLMSQAFYHADARGCLVKSPAELVASTARMFGTKVYDLRAAERAMAAMGQELMQPPNVKGWDGGTAWINTATLFNRYNAVARLISGGGERGRRRADDSVDSDAEYNMMMMSPAAKSRTEREMQPAYDGLAVVRAQGLSDAAEIVDYFCENLLAVPLAGGKRDQLAAYLDDGKRFDVDDRGAKQRLRMMLTLLCSTPEFQMY
jgi:uncharacterized protein (DUF1800 family)